MNEHQQTALLMPWYVNGTLNEQEMASVESHLAGCTACRAALDADVAEARALHAGNDEARVAALVAGRERAFESLRAQLHSGAPHRRPAVPARWVPALAALLVIGAVLPAAWLMPGPTIYHLRTSTVASESPVLQVVFREGTSTEDIDLLIRTSGTLLGPPTSGGVYRIALATDDPQALLARIRSHPAVRWAEIEL
jgi:anti-sigma factor RsiW